MTLTSTPRKEASARLLEETCLAPLRAGGATLVEVELWADGEISHRP